MENIQLYFKAERTESLVFIAIGIIAFAACIYFLFSFKKPFYTGIAINHYCGYSIICWWRSFYSLAKRYRLRRNNVLN